MQVSKIQSVNYQPTCNKNNSLKNTNYLTNRVKQPGVSFKAEPFTVFVLGAVAKKLAIASGVKRAIAWIMQIRRDIKIDKFNDEFNKILKDISQNPENLIQKVPSMLKSLKDKKLDGVLCDVEVIRAEATTNLLPALDDSQPLHKFVKQDYMKYMYDESKFQNSHFIEAFRNLSDVNHCLFKEKIGQEALFSTKSPSKILPESLDKFAYKYLITKSLDNGKHAEFISKNKDLLAKQKEMLFSKINNNIAEKRNNAYLLYSKESLELNSIYSDYIKTKIAKNEMSVNASARDLNMDKELVEDIIKDMETELKLKMTSDPLVRCEIENARLHEKLISKNNLINKQAESYAQKAEFSEELKEKVRNFKNAVSDAYTHEDDRIDHSISSFWI